jgi:hypothetical protein
MGIDNCARSIPLTLGGVFHYPRRWGVQKGFSLLKESMIKRHEDEINALMKSLSELRLVQLPNDKAKPSACKERTK